MKGAVTCGHKTDLVQCNFSWNELGREPQGLALPETRDAACCVPLWSASQVEGGWTRVQHAGFLFCSSRCSGTFFFPQKATAIRLYR